MTRNVSIAAVAVVAVLLMAPLAAAEKHQQQGRCAACSIREEVKNRSREAIKHRILTVLGFPSVPKFNKTNLPKVPAYFMDQFDQSHGGMQSDEPQFKTGVSFSEEEDDYYVQTKSVLSFAQPYPRLRHSWKGHDILHFSFSNSITKYHVTNATLRVYVRGTDRRPAADVLIEVFRVIRPPDHPDYPVMKLVAAKKVAQPYGDGDYVEIDLTDTVSEWFKNNNNNYGFVLNATVNGRRVGVTDVKGDKGNKAPFVEIVTKEGRRRTRRNVGLNCDDKSNQSVCCRYPLTVDFEEFGWDFIIAPKRYEANYCSGDCPYVTLQKHPHTHLMQMTSPDMVGPCCAPRKYSGIWMLYFDKEQNVVYGNLPGMVVDRCGCS